MMIKSIVSIVISLFTIYIGLWPIGIIGIILTMKFAYDALIEYRKNKGE